jgi:glycosyltransferase involved in cell wall biosynthesis
MRILLISSYYKPAYVYGGPVRCVSQLCEAMVQLNSEITVLTTNINGNELLEVPLGKPVNVDGVEVFYYPIRRVLHSNFVFSMGLVNACYREVSQYDIVFLQSLFSYEIRPAIIACKEVNSPYVIQLHGQLLPWSLRHKKLKKKIFLTLMGRNYLNKANALHCTVHSEDEALDGMGITAPRIIIPNGVDNGYFTQLPPRGYLRKRFRIPDNANILLFFGRLHTKKRPDIAVEVLAATQNLPCETHLILAGPDEMQLIPKLYSQADRLGCADRLHSTGLLQGDEILSVLSDSDLLLMPSEPESENFGMSAVEAMATGLPILVSDGVPVGSWAEKAGAGRMVACNRNEFQKTAIDMLGQPSQLKKMGEKGKVLVREKFDIRTIAQQMLNEFESIMETGKPSPQNAFDIT